MLHFQDNMASESSEDRLQNIRPVIDHMRSKCMEIESENQFSIDEMMGPYKGKKVGSLRQYLPSKPKKWGFKIVVEVKRYSKQHQRRISVPCPKIASEYNTHMGGVDLADVMIALHHTPAKYHWWYLGICWQLIDIAVNNSVSNASLPP
ncbi:hypothetical protein AAFF_G00019390 [Aldrovandia affinis]|uniref:PiggyBac transposable element-derived protein domain-containing protein n=1 Tax=Aldrovandia affinis TaxID=143900 RepID=A0AAD7S5H3_9TELE|nr:hypothetical protein AAFF_G00019390 [Aldrovandia affinis]